MPTDLEVAWAAGLFEGEGCISKSNPKGKPYLVLALAMTDEDIVQRFVGIMGVGKIRVEKLATVTTKQQWSWRISAGPAHRTLPLLLPWLGERRRARAAEVLAMCPQPGLRNEEWARARWAGRPTEPVSVASTGASKQELDLAWAAGLFEAEGCITRSVNKSNTYLQLSLTSTDEDVVRNFHGVMQTGRLYDIRPQRVGNKPAWRWMVFGREAHPSLDLLLPSLGRRRVERARELLETVNRPDVQTAPREAHLVG